MNEMKQCQHYGNSEIAMHLHLFGTMREKIELPPWVYFHGPAYSDELLNTVTLLECKP